MPQQKIFLSIVTPVYNNTQALMDLLSSINRSNFRAFDSIEAIIVDDGSKNNPDYSLRKLEKQMKFSITIRRLEKNSGPAFARNFGVSKAYGQYILFLDADVLLKKDTLQKSFDFFKRKKGRAFTGIWSKTQKNKRWFPQFKALRDHAYWFIEREQNARYYLFSTRIAGIEKKLFENIGGFTTSYTKPTVEDIELTYKIEKHAKISFEPNIVVYHEFEDFFALSRKYFLRSRDWIKLYIKRLRFDPVATSKHEAYKSVVSGLLFIFLILYFISGETILIVITALLFVIFLIQEYRFLQFLLREKGLVFMLYAIPTALMLYLIINIGSCIGLVEYYFRKPKGLTSRPPLRTSK